MNDFSKLLILRTKSCLPLFCFNQIYLQFLELPIYQPIFIFQRKIGIPLFTFSLLCLNSLTAIAGLLMHSTPKIQYMYEQHYQNVL